MLAKRLVGETTVPDQPLYVIFNCMGKFWIPSFKGVLQSERYILYVNFLATALT